MGVFQFRPKQVSSSTVNVSKVVVSKPRKQSGYELVPQPTDIEDVDDFFIRSLSKPFIPRQDQCHIHGIFISDELSCVICNRLKKRK